MKCLTIQCWFVSHKLCLVKFPNFPSRPALIYLFFLNLLSILPLLLLFKYFPHFLLSSGAVFTGYYQNNPPGVYFSMSVLLSLLQALLKAGMVSDIFSVLSVSLVHKILVSLVFIHLMTDVSRFSRLCSPVEGRACSVLYEEWSDGDFQIASYLCWYKYTWWTYSPLHLLIAWAWVPAGPL